MKLLLDTHILLWTLTNDPKLSAKARKFLENEENEIYFSIISLWEVELKHLAHPDQMTLTAVELIDYCQQSGFQLLSIHESHIFALSGLTRKEGEPLHKDPFDRILICQGAIENMLFLTHDSLIAGYEELCIIIV